MSCSSSPMNNVTELVPSIFSCEMGKNICLLIFKIHHRLWITSYQWYSRQWVVSQSRKKLIMCLCYKKQSSPFVAVLWHFPFHLSCSSDHQAAAQTFRCRYLEQPEHSLTMSLKLVSQTSLNLKRQTDILMGKDFNLFSIS